MLQTVNLTDIVFDESIYPREDADSRRVDRYVACMRDGDVFPPIKVEVQGAKYRLLDGRHRQKAYNEVGVAQVEIEIIELNGQDALLFAAHCQDRGGDLRDNDARMVARKAYSKNPSLTNRAIASEIGRSDRIVKDYIGDLRATYETAQDVKIFKMALLGITQDRIAARLGMSQKTVDEHLAETEELQKALNEQVRRGFGINVIAQKLGWPEPLVWAVALKDKPDQDRFTELKWKVRPWDNWYFNDIDARFGSDWPGRIPAQLIAHTLYFFTNPGDLVFDPMAGGGTTPDVCLAMNRQCWSFDKENRPDERPEIEPFSWNLHQPEWPLNSKGKADLIFFDPPYYKKKEAEYKDDSISSLDRTEYLAFFDAWASLAIENSKGKTRLAFLMADWRDFQSKAAVDEDPATSIMIFDYRDVLTRAGWQLTHRLETAMPSERFTGNMVEAMQKKRELGTVVRTLLMFRRTK